MASRSLNDLAGPVKKAALDFQVAAAAGGLDVLIYCTLRSSADQASLYALGRTVPGKIVTHARPGASLHNPDASGKSWAFDAAPMVGGKCMFHDEPLLLKMGLIGETVGLQWAGRWRGRIRESVHFQMTRR